MNPVESRTNLLNPIGSQSLISLTTSTADQLSTTERWPYDEEVTSRHSREEDEQLQVLQDLMAFESRLRELHTDTDTDTDRPYNYQWIPVFGIIFASTAVSACRWLPSVRNSHSIVLRSLSSRGALTLSLATIFLTVFFGIKHINRKRNQSVKLSKDIVALFQLECDKNGKFVGTPNKNILQSHVSHND